MNEVEKQILRNQATILLGIGSLVSSEILYHVSNRLNETKILTNPKEEQSLPEKTKDALEKKE